jgi:ribose transport system substrate-binding protein
MAYRPAAHRAAEPEGAVERRGDRNESLTVLRACEVLRSFRRTGEELSLQEAMSRSGLPKTTAFRLLRTLVHGGDRRDGSEGSRRRRL